MALGHFNQDERSRTGRCNAVLCTVALFAGALVSMPAEMMAQFQAERYSPDRFELSQRIEIEDKEIGEVRPHLDLAAALAKDGKWGEAIKTYRKVSADYGDKVIQLTDRRYENVRAYCQLKISQMPAEALQLYRRGVDPVAEQWFTEGKKNRDVRTLRKIVETLFCSSYGDDALEVLGEIALERGAYGEARRYWEMLSPRLRTPEGKSVWLDLVTRDLPSAWPDIESQYRSRTNTTSWLAFPDTDLDLAAVRARLVLVSILEGSFDRARMELELFERLHGDANGSLAGRKGPYRKRLAALLVKSSQWPQPTVGENWSTFASSPTRNSQLSESIEMSENPMWKATIDPDFKEPSGGNPAVRPLTHHPLLVDSLVLYNDRTSVFALNVSDGEPAWPQAKRGAKRGEFYTLPDNPFQTGRSYVRTPGGQGSPRYTMTARDGKLFARLGGASSVSANYLACFDLRREGELLWKVPRNDARSEFMQQRWVFEGPPVADGAHVYLGMRRGQTWPVSHVACFEADSGRLLWRTRVCSADSLHSSANNLLTLHEGVLYYNTNLGAIAALETETGRIRWIHRYQRTEGEFSSSLPTSNLNPCIYHQGLVIVGPSDSDTIVALDASTGVAQWNTVRLSPEDLLGVSGGAFIATGHRGVWWFNVATGKLEAEWPVQGREAVRGHGRGLLADGAIYWPTEEKILVLKARIGQPSAGSVLRGEIRIVPTEPDGTPGLEGGNLVVGPEHVIVAKRNHLFAFERFRSRRTEQKLPDVRQPPGKTRTPERPKSP